MATRDSFMMTIRACKALLCAALIAWVPGLQADSPEPLLIPVGLPETAGLPDFVVASQQVRVNQRALRSPALSIQLPDGTVVIADRKFEVVDAVPGYRSWVGDLREGEGEVIVTARGAHFSAQIVVGEEQVYEIHRAVDGAESVFELVEMELGNLPPEDLGGVPDGVDGSEASASVAEPAAENVVQDLLVVYNQNACNKVGSCGQLETNIVNAVAAMNTAYAESGINITSNLVGMSLTNYSGTSTSQALSDLRMTTDGQMDEVHALRDQLGADLVAMIHDGDGCGIGYLGGSAAYAFSVTDYTCLGGNRTLSHEIGHNQGAHHDRITVANGGGSTPADSYNFGYRRCSNGSVDDLGSPYFRTIMSYSCGYARVGRYSNPNINYSGVPQGVDPALVTDPSTQQGGAWNARTLNESANYVAGFRQSASTQPPAAPSGLGASAQGPDTLVVSWSDNSNDETGFVLQSADSDPASGGSWSDLASLGAGSTSYMDTGLAPESTRWYRVRAYNSAGSSAFSNTGSATTDPLPSEVLDKALADNPGSGTVTGSYLDTRDSGAGYQTITETHAGGPKRRRKQSFDHAWEFDVFGGAGGVILTVNAWVSGSEGARFWYSTDGGATRVTMLTVDNSSPGADQTFPLPGGTSGPLLVGVSDAEQSNGEAVDSVYVDYLLITSYTEPASPPADPSSLAVTGWTSGSVDLSVTDNADNEWGLEFWRSTAILADCRTGTSVGTVAGSETPAGTVTFTDGSAAPDQTYYYWATAFNGGGDSGCSNVQQVTTDPAPALSISVSPYKVKGQQKVDLVWSASAAVEVYRDGVTPVSTLTINADGVSGTDNINAKGGGSYEYKICLVSDPGQCSAPQMAIF